MRKILLVDDHNLIYAGLKGAVRHYELEYASSNDEALKKIRDKHYYAVILDITIGEQKGFDVVYSVPGNCYIYFLTMHKSSVYIQLAKDMGAKGYFLKDESSELLVEALNSPLSRSFWMSPTVADELSRAESYEGSNYEKLSPREQQIFAMLAEDMSYIEIAKRLSLSRKTVNNHRDHIMKKLEISSQIALVKEAVRLGIISI